MMEDGRMGKFLIKVIDRKTEKELKFTSIEKPSNDSYSVSFTDRDNQFKLFPKEFYIIQVEEVSL
jgi:hypothetical protein